jgi:hypothetical protein
MQQGGCQLLWDARGVLTLQFFYADGRAGPNTETKDHALPSVASVHGVLAGLSLLQARGYHIAGYKKLFNQRWLTGEECSIHRSSPEISSVFGAALRRDLTTPFWRRA